MIEVLHTLLRRRVLIMRVAALIMGVSVAVALARPTLYTSSVAFLAESSEGGGGGALALAQQFGLSIGNADGQRTPEFYAGLVTSMEILRQTVTKSYARTQVREESAKTDLLSYYDVRGGSDAEQIERTMELLEEDISVSTDRETGVVRFSVTMSDPQLAQGVAQRLLDLVHSFDLTTRQTQAGAERRFSGERVAELTAELRDAEDSLKSFLSENRVFDNSPVLLFEHDRLQRDVAMRQELVTSLAGAFERARIEEVRNTPVITLIDPPRVPAVRDPKRRVLILVLGLVLGVMAGAVAAFLREGAEQARKLKSADLEGLSSAWKETLSDMRRLVRHPFGRAAR